MNTPYIGVTDFVFSSHVDVIKELIPPWVDRRLHVGAMMSHKTLHGIPTSTGWEKIWLNQMGLGALFYTKDDPLIFNVLHYADYPENGIVKTTPRDVIKAVDIAGPCVQGLQLDMIWPSKKLINEVKGAYPDLEIIMQVSHKALEQAHSHDLSMTDVLSTYPLDALSYILIDFGMGRGTPFDPQHALSLIEEALTVLPQRKIAVAGGLGPDTYENLRPILRKYPDISCDAQGQLRPSMKATDPLDMQRVTKYVNGVCSLL